MGEGFGGGASHSLQQSRRRLVHQNLRRESDWLTHAHVQTVFGSVDSLQLLEVLAGVPDVNQSSCGRCNKEHASVLTHGQERQVLL